MRGGLRKEENRGGAEISANAATDPNIHGNHSTTCHTTPFTDSIQVRRASETNECPPHIIVPGHASVVAFSFL